MKCKNCKEDLSGQMKFCSNCGQKNIAKLNLKYILSQFVEDIFNVDSKVFRTLRYLSIKPGFLTQEYIEGKRVNYVPPIRLYIVMSVLFFFVFSMIDFGDMPVTNYSFGNESQASIVKDTITVDGVKFTINNKTVTVLTEELKRLDYEGRLEEGLDSLTAEMPSFAAYISRKAALSKIKDEGFFDILTDQFSLFLLLFLPFFALMYATLFSGRKKGFIGHLIFNLHLNSFVMFSLLIVFLMDLIVPDDISLIDGISIDTLPGIIVFLFGQYYLIKAIMRFYECKWWIAFYKYIFLMIGYLILAIVFFLFVFASSLLLV